MNRGSKYNLYECPECKYGTTRKYNLRMHMIKQHGSRVFPYAYTSQKDWVWAQRRSLERAYIEEAKTEDEKKEADRKLRDFLITWGQKGFWDYVSATGEAWKARRQRDEKSKQQGADIKRPG